jgi:hypothetical protein
MSTVAPPTTYANDALSRSTPGTKAVEDFARRSVDEWLAVCGQFLAWHKSNRLLQDAPPENCHESDRAHAWLLRSIRMIQGQMLDPDFPHLDLARRVETVLWQLEEAWAQTHNPMTEGEADILITKFFPADAPGT